MLVLCKDCSPAVAPIQITKQFTVADPLVVAVAAMDKRGGPVAVDFVWSHRGQAVVKQQRSYTPDVSEPEHRVAAFLKMSFFEYKKMFGSWTVSLYVNGKLLAENEFTVKPPFVKYTCGKNTSSFQQGNAIVSMNA